jgi:hypothetical protein
MAFHLMGWSESQDTAVLASAAALPDQAIQVNGDQVIVPNDLTQLIFYYALGPSATRAAIVSPSLRRMFNEEILPLDLAAVATDQSLVVDHTQSPLILDAGEPVEAQMAEGAAGASRVTILAALADGIPQPQSGDFHTIRVSSSTAAVANVWSNIPLTFNDVLPSGMYAVVGAMLQSTNMQAFRFAFKGGSYRPGAPGITTLGQRHNRLFRNGNLGVWGTFENLTPPSADVLCNGADAAFAGVLDLVQIQAYR